MKRAKKVEAWVWVNQTHLTEQEARRHRPFMAASYGYRLVHLTEPSPLTAKERAELRKLRRVAKAAGALLRDGEQIVSRPGAMYPEWAALWDAVAALEKGND